MVMTQKIPLVLLPGMMCDARMWQMQIDGLSDLCQPILVGDITSASSIKDIAGQLLARLPEHFALAGLSMGGIVALETWRQARHRISHLALIDTNALAEQPERQARRAGEIRRAYQDLRDLVINGIKLHYLADANRHNRELLDLVVSMAVDFGPEVFERQSIALRDRPDAVDLLPAIDCPTMIICGDEDQLCPLDHHRFMHSQINGSELHIIGECGHLSTLERPLEMINLMRQWLRH